ncbi:NAD-dependent epimerase/dehydratase family protein [Microbacterium enclense]|uniref:NAD-dependent epimerase/dehydratase family protein n=1 Tax=Microbacterium enclense TaxID=993073 RepID=UPI003F7DC877
MIGAFVVGGGGLIGSGVLRALSRRGIVSHSAKNVPWNDVGAAKNELSEIARSGRIATGDHVYWCAGVGVHDMSPSAAEAEVALFQAFLTKLPGGVRLFVASSAGGAYAGGDNPPFTEYSPIAANSDYGRCKIAIERVATRWAQAGRGQVVIGRIANAYGPCQNLRKPQGIVSHLCRAAIVGTPIEVYVPLGTIRDFIYIDDAADRIVETCLLSAGEVAIKIICSGEGITLRSVIETVERISNRSPLSVPGTSATNYSQAADLRLRSAVLPEVDSRPLTSFDAGVRSTWRELSHQGIS